MGKTLVVILGPTGVGKTELSLEVAEAFRCPILSCDSRQIYRELPIGTAAATAAEQARVPHYFVGSHSVTEDYNAGQYERDALQLLSELFTQHDVVVMTGGSTLYIDAICRGLDDIPQPDPAIRERVRQQYEVLGLAWLQEQVAAIDPVYWAEADQQNPHRLLRCLEVSLSSGKPYSTFRTAGRSARPFRIVKIGIRRDREELYDRINRRVEAMMAAGLEEEVRSVLPYRDRNSLQTVGYRELFGYLDGKYPLSEAIRLIQQNSRHYAKRQMTWFRQDPEITWLDAKAATAADVVRIVEARGEEAISEKI